MLRGSLHHGIANVSDSNIYFLVVPQTYRVLDLLALCRCAIYVDVDLVCLHGCHCQVGESESY